jgi:hypothetical protein
MAKVEKDYEELLKLFNKNKVRYCIVGAYAFAFYAKPRYTKDMDILIEPSITNACQIIKSLNEFGFESLRLTEKDFSRKNRIIQLGYEPLRVDILTSIQGCTFKEVWKNRRTANYGKQKAFFIGIGELINNKKASRRQQDKLDLAILLQSQKLKR